MKDLRDIGLCVAIISAGFADRIPDWLWIAGVAVGGATFSFASDGLERARRSREESP